MSDNCQYQNASDADIADLVIQLSLRLLANRICIATVESCTGGSVAAALTDLAGSSNWFDRGFVTYSNQAKTDMVGVRTETLDAYGAVSEAVAIEMADGGVSHGEAGCALSITGVAGPGGGTPEKPVGMVCFAWSGFGVRTQARTEYFQGTRSEIRQQSVACAVAYAIKLFE